MKRRIIALLLLLTALTGLLAGCGAAETVLDLIEAYEDTSDAATGPQDAVEESEDSLAHAEDAPDEDAVPEDDDQEICSLPLADSAAVNENGEYSSPEEVAAYIHTYGKLPGNFITKNEARGLGWDNSKGNLWDVAPGKSIGGDRFGNYEGLLPEGKYRECDVNYAGGYRGAERLIYGEDGSVWYTNDHYESFTQLY